VSAERLKARNPVKEKLLRDELSLGCFTTSGSALCAEIVSRAGFEWVLVDMEHFPIDVEAAANIFRGIQLMGSLPVARVPAADEVWIKRALDAGALGIVTPLIRTVEEVRMVAASTRYPPLGRRPFGGGRVGSIYGRDYLQDANEAILVVVQIETVEAVQQLDEILAVDGIDGCFVGPVDLSMSHGIPLDDAGDAQRAELIRELCARIRAAGRIAGITASTPEQLAERLACGYRMVCNSSDLLMLYEAAVDAVNVARKAAEQ